VKLCRTGKGIQPPVVDNHSVVGPKLSLIGPEPKVIQLDHAVASMTSRQLAQRPHPIEVPMRIASDQQTRLIAHRAGDLAKRHADYQATDAWLSVDEFGDRGQASISSAGLPSAACRQRARRAVVSRTEANECGRGRR
jgi:hypothetical protein